MLPICNMGDIEIMSISYHIKYMLLGIIKIWFFLNSKPISRININNISTHDNEVRGISKEI